MKKVYVSWRDVEQQVQDVSQQIWIDNWRPDYVVGITRGGLVPGNLLSQYLDCPMHTLKVSLRDGDDTESNLWMAEDAANPIIESRKNILIVDDINDSGATLNWIMDDWASSCAVYSDDDWKEVWGVNVRFAVLYDNEASKANQAVSYSAITVNKHEDPQWIVFPWEEFWKSH
jgi:xanthine phosphoribosyltransferase